MNNTVLFLNSLMHLDATLLFLLRRMVRLLTILLGAI